MLSLVRTVLRDPAQSEEVAQEVLVELWRTAPPVRPGTGVRDDLGPDDGPPAGGGPGPLGGLDERRPFDEVAETVTIRLEQARVRRCVSTLTSLQRESVLLAFYRGHTYRRWRSSSVPRWGQSGPGCGTP